MSEDYSKHYIQNDALCPRPHSGPRVVVGFWIGPIETEEKPQLFGDPLFTITYPVGHDTCFNWKHMTGDPEDPLHPNSANQIQWVGGHLQFTQSTEFGCRPNLARITEPTTKEAFWELSQDFPLELWSRIVATHEITDVAPRENSVVHFCAADGHYINTNEAGEVVCEKRLLDPSCAFTTSFPNYVWDTNGGRGDRDNCFYLKANNGYFLRAEEQDQGTVLRADAKAKDQATLWVATQSGNMVSLATQTSQTLTHEPPYGALKLTCEPDATWSWFSMSYA